MTHVSFAIAATALTLTALSSWRVRATSLGRSFLSFVVAAEVDEADGSDPAAAPPKLNGAAPLAAGAAAAFGVAAAAVPNPIDAAGVWVADPNVFTLLVGVAAASPNCGTAAGMVGAVGTKGEDVLGAAAEKSVAPDSGLSAGAALTPPIKKKRHQFNAHFS